MKRLIILFLLLLIPIVIAVEDTEYESYKVNEIAHLKIRVANATDIITDANCTLDIYNPSNVLLIDNGNLSYSGRRYNYTYVFNEVGEWFVEYSCYNIARDETTIYGKEISIQEFDISDTSINYTQIQEDVWDESNRTLTYYPPATVNNTAVAQGVWTSPVRTLTNLTNVAPDLWGGNYTINTGLLGQITGGVWNFVARYIHGEII